MGFGLKRRSRELLGDVFDLILIPAHERYHWPEKDYLQRLLSILNIDCVIDVGANRGQYGRWLRSLGFGGLIVSFEPNPTAFAKLQQHASENWLCFPFALGSEEAELPFNIMADDVFSSFHAPSDAKEYAAENSPVSTVTVPIKRLDDMFAEVAATAARPFLKLDTQGFDLEVIKGAERTISRFQGIVSEVSIKRLYDGSPTFEESRATMDRLGFEPGNMFSVNPYKTFSLIEMNAYFIRRDLVTLDPL
jgi:FkbM family methyltransferase